jgi:hypothetical protein
LEVGLWRLGWGQAHDELGLATAQAKLDRARRELQGDLLRRRRKGILHGQPDGRFERCDKTLGQGAGVLPAGLGGEPELVAQVLDVGIQIHGVIVTSL